MPAFFRSSAHRKRTIFLSAATLLTVITIALAGCATVAPVMQAKLTRPG